MFKNFFLLVVNVVGAGYLGWKMLFYPEQTDMWIIRAVGFIFFLQAVGYISDIIKTRLDQRIEKLKQKESTNADI
jgi:hypothetical protein